MKKSIYTKCPPCGGTGIELVSSVIDGNDINTEITCRTCLGEKKISNMFLSKLLIDTIDDISSKVDEILVKVT